MFGSFHSLRTTLRHATNISLTLSLQVKETIIKRSSYLIALGFSFSLLSRNAQKSVRPLWKRSGEILQFNKIIYSAYYTGACPGGGGPIQKQKKRSSEQILSYFTYILVLFWSEISFSLLFSELSPP